METAEQVVETTLETEVPAAEVVGEIREIRGNVLKLALPAIVRNVFQSAIGIVNVAIVGNLGTQPLAAVGIANTLIDFVIMTFMALGIGATALVARHLGAKEQDAANTVAKQAVIICVMAAGVIGLLFFLFPDKAIGFMMSMDRRGDPQVLQMGSGYLRIVAITLPLALIMSVIGSISQGAGDMKTPMFITGFINIINGFLCYALVYGVWSFPALGVNGAAISAAIARAIGGVLALIVIFSGRIPVRLFIRDRYRLDMVVVRRLMKVSIPAIVEQGVMQSSRVIYTIFVASMGTMSVAANQIAMTSQSISFMPGYGFALAATTLVGQSLGAKRPGKAEACGREANRMAMILMGIMGLLFFFFAPQIVGFFSKDPEVVALAATCLRIVAISQPALAVSMTMAGALRGAGDTKWVMQNTTLGTYGVRLLFSYVIGIYLGIGLIGVWIAMASDVILRGFLAFRRFAAGRWKDIEI